MKVVFVSDLHSNKKLYGELEELILDVSANALIIGGDLFDYSSDISPQIEFAKDFLVEFLKKLPINIYLIPGNCDRPNAVRYLFERINQENIEILGIKGVFLTKNIKLLGYENIPPSPFKIKDYERRDLVQDSISFDIPCLLSDENAKLHLVSSDFINEIPSIEEELSISHEKNSIWVMHSPPYGGILDKTHMEIFAGSKAIRKHIEHVQPSLTLHGHIHEAPLVSKQWAERIGNTISINAGCGETLHAAIFDIDSGGNVKNIRHNIYGELTV